LLAACYGVASFDRVWPAGGVLDRIRRRWKLWTAAAVVVVVLAVCMGKYWPSQDGPTYTQAGHDLCASLPFEVFEPTLGPMLADPQPGVPQLGDGVGCQVEFDSSPEITMTATMGFFGSTGEAQEEYYANRSAMTERDVWDLQTSARKAQWSLGRFEARGMAFDGNMVVFGVLYAGRHVRHHRRKFRGTDGQLPQRGDRCRAQG
jgi:hypothetical protein